jgi:hypothetical protein
MNSNAAHTTTSSSSSSLRCLPVLLITSSGQANVEEIQSLRDLFPYAQKLPLGLHSYGVDRPFCVKRAAQDDTEERPRPRKYPKTTFEGWFAETHF